MSVIHISANSRLTQTLKQSMFSQQDHLVAETPQIMTLAQWWDQWEQNALLCGDIAMDAPIKKRLTAFESQMIWESILETESQKRLDEHGQPLDLLNLSNTAKQLYQAWSYWMEWLSEEQQTLSADQHFDAAEVALFKACLKQYQILLEKHDWQDAVLHQHQQLNGLANALGVHQGAKQDSKQDAKQGMKKNAHRMPNRFELHGFDDITPFMQTWISTVQAFGCEVITHQTALPITPDNIKIYRARDAQDEVQQVAYWCVQQWLKRQKSQAHYEIKIAVIAPNLADYKAPLSRALHEQLALSAQQHLPLHDTDTESLFNISLGVALNEVPLVQNALLTLKLFCQPKRPCHYSDWSRWLISPYTSGDWVGNQKADAKLRAQQWAHFKWPRLIESDSARALSPQLKAKFVTWQPIIESKAHLKMGVSEFVQLVSECLQTLGWCHNRTLSSDEKQQQNAWFKRLEAFSALTETQGHQSVSYWLAVLQRFVSEAVHQSQSKGVQPIQIMGMLEAGGQQFDALWVMGLNDEAWPRMPNPNPFLPILLQRAHAMPRCDAQKELRYAQHVTERLYHSTTEQVWSYAVQQGEAQMRISPLLETERFNHAKVYAPKGYQTLSKASFDQRSVLDWVLDHRGPQIPIDLIHPLKAPGGTGILQAQSQCPLMAFIDYRLGARNGLKAVEDGLQTTNQGTLIHEILEHFWLEFKTQTTLLTLSEKALHEALKKHIQNQFNQLARSFDEHYLKLEQARIFELLCQWMDLEKQRPNFAVIDTEKMIPITLAGITFSVAVDRIDLVAGESVILDYKTGKANAANLFKSPIKAPQLAVYLFTTKAQVCGLGYGLLHSDDGVKISAVANEQSVFDSKARSIHVFANMAEKEGGDFYEVAWPDFLDSLRQEVLDLATQIQQGVADMRFEKPTDVAYANGRLALRLPEVERQLTQAGLMQEEQA